MRRGYFLIITLAVASVGLATLMLALAWPAPVSHAAPLPQPANDDFANALVISPLPYTDAQDTTLATTEANDPRFPCIANNPPTNWGQGWHSVWYVYTATVDGALHVDTLGSDYDTVLGIWTGSWGALANVGCDDDVSWPSIPQSSLDISVVSGTTYYVEAVGYRSTELGNLVLSASVLVPPPNDDFANAFVIDDNPYSYTQTTALATTQPNDPRFPCIANSGTTNWGQGWHSVWYAYSATDDGSLHVDTNGSDYDTVLGVWTGSWGSLTNVGCDDDSGAGTQSSLDVAISAGTTYYVEIAGYYDSSYGSLALNASAAVVKPLYLHNLSSAVTIVDGSSTTEIMDRLEVWGGEATVTFDNSPTYYSYLYPGLAGDLTLRGTIRVPLYIEADDAQNSNVTVSIIDLAPDSSTTVIGTTSLAVPRNSDGWYTFNIANVDYTVPLGHAVAVGMRTGAAAQDVTLHYDAAAYNSRVELPVVNAIAVEQVTTASACHPGGASFFSQGQALTITARVSDPFGSYDVAGADVLVTDPGGTPVVPGLAMMPVVTSTDAVTFEHVYNVPAAATLGVYTSVVTGSEGNGVQATASVTFTVQRPAVLTSSLVAAPLAVYHGQPIAVTMLVANSGQVTATNVAPSLLTQGGTGAASLASGPTPASTDVPAGGVVVTFTWVYTGTDIGTVNWSGNASGTDANSCASVSSTVTTSNDVQVILKLEVGTASVGSSWIAVDLANTYDAMVVVCSLQNTASDAPMVPRIQNAGGSSFQVMLQAAGTGSVSARPVHYVVMESGAYTLPNGIHVEAQKYTSTVTSGRSNWVQDPASPGYLNTYANPVVIGQVMSYEDARWSVFWAQGSSRASPPSSTQLETGKHVSKDTPVSRANELLGFIVIERGHDEMFGVAYEAWVGSDTVAGMDNTPPYVYSFQQAFTTTPAIALVTQAGEDGGDGGWVVLHDDDPLTASTIDLAIDEDNINGNRSHTTEQVAYLVFERPLVVTPGPYLEISKEVSKVGVGSLVLPGDTLSYTVSYANVGLSAATNVAITDRLPADTIFAGASPGCAHDGSPADGLITCAVGSLDVLGSGSVGITVTVSSNVTQNTTLTNTVIVGCAEGVSATASVTTAVTAVSLAKLETLTTTAFYTWTTVSLNNVYNDMVAVCTLNYRNNTRPVVTHIRNASQSSFDLRLQNPGDSFTPVAETVHCLVTEAGAFTLPDGRRIEAQKYSTTLTDENGAWVGQQQSYLQSYVSPVVLGQVMSANDPDWSVFWARGNVRENPPSASILYTGKTVCEDTDVTRSDEAVAFIVVEQGNGVFGSTAYEAWLGADTVQGAADSPPYNYTFNQPFASTPQIALASLAAMDGGNGGWAVLFGANPLSSNTISLAIDEDQIGDTERNHTTEQVAYLVFEETVVITPTHDLHISKTDRPDPVAVGNLLGYTIAYTSAGVLTATNVIITESYDANVVYSSSSVSPSVGDNVWQLGDLGPNQAATLIVTVTVNGGLPNSTTLTNTVTLGSDQTAPVTDTETTLVRAPSLQLSKADSPDPVVTGATLTYTLVYTNASFTDALDVTITDTLPINVVYGGLVGATPLVTQTGTSPPAWYTPTLPAGTFGTIVFTVTVNNLLPDGTILTNTASLDSRYADSVATAETTLVRAPMLQLTKVDNPDPVDLFGNLVYTLTVTNSGAVAASGVVITETYDSNVNFSSANPAPDVGNNVWYLGTLNAGQSVDVVIVVSVSGGTTLDNVATLNSDQTLTTTASATTTVRALPNLSVSKVDDPDPVPVGGSLVYTISYGNSGVVSATNVIITETYDSDVQFVSSNPPPDAGNNVWNVGMLTPGQSGTIVINTTVITSTTPGSTLVNQARIGCAEGAYGQATISTTVETPEPIYVIEAQVGGMRIRARVRMENGEPIVISWEILP
jgi:uncharacterized repeat protein (TIGR01451 family)